MKTKVTIMVLIYSLILFPNLVDIPKNPVIHLIYFIGLWNTFIYFDKFLDWNFSEDNSQYFPERIEEYYIRSSGTQIIKTFRGNQLISENRYQ